MSVLPCPHCGAKELVQHAWQQACLACGKWSGEKPPAPEVVHDNLDRRIDVTGPSADAPAATPTSLITGARPAAMTTTPELEGKKLATKSGKDATQVPAAPVAPTDPTPPSGQADPEKKLDPAPFGPPSAPSAPPVEGA